MLLQDAGWNDTRAFRRPEAGDTRYVNIRQNIPVNLLLLIRRLWTLMDVHNIEQIFTIITISPSIQRTKSDEAEQLIR